MAKITNTFVTTDAKGNREQLSDIVTRIDPEDTPIYSMIGHPRFSGKHPEWETIDLAAPAANAQAEGDEYTFTASTAAVRYGNYTQILRKAKIVSGSQDAENNAGKAEQLSEIKLRAGIELRKDVELSIVSNVASVAGETRVSGGLPSWLTSNVSRGSGGASGGFNTSDGLTDVATDGTRRALTKALVDDVLQSAYQSGANVKHIVVSPYATRVFSTFMSDSNVAPFRMAAKNGSNVLVGSVSAYLSDFGLVDVHSNRVMSTSATSRNAFLIDPEMLQWGWFRPIQEDKDIAKTGDAKKMVLIGEGCLKVKSEKGLGVVADLFGLTASS